MNLESTLSVYSGGPGSGCQGSNCGRKRSKFIFHGTSEKSARSILVQGLKSDTLQYAADNRKQAIEYAQFRRGDGNAAVVVIKNPKKNGFYETDPDEDNRKIYESAHDIAPKHIVKVELYDKRGNKVGTLKP
jgi:hypothetical protein